MPSSEQAIDLAKHSRRRDAHSVGFGERDLRITHARVKLREVYMLHLNSAAACEFLIQMLPCTAKRLARALRFGPQSLAMRTRSARQQVFIELVPVSGDVRQ